MNLSAMPLRLISIYTNVFAFRISLIVLLSFALFHVYVVPNCGQFFAVQQHISICLKFWYSLIVGNQLWF